MPLHGRIRDVKKMGWYSRMKIHADAIDRHHAPSLTLLTSFMGERESRLVPLSSTKASTFMHHD